MKKLELYDVTIVGGGPAGMYSTFYSGMRDMKTKLIESSKELGGRLLIYPEKMIWDVGGLPPILGGRLIQQLQQQARTFDPTIVLEEKIVQVEKDEEGHFLLTSESGQKHYSKTVILAVGYGILQMQKLAIEGAERYELTNLFYTVQEVETFRNKQVVISGGGNSAVDWANTLIPVAASVTVVHRRETFGGHEMSVKKMKESAANVYTSSEVTKLHGTSNLLHHVTIKSHITNQEITLDTDAVIVNHGLKSDLEALKQWGIEMKEHSAVVSPTCETAIPGLYGVGDFVTYESKVRLIAGTFTDAALAVNQAKKWIEPDAPSVAFVSSHNIRFKEKNKHLGLHDSDYREVRG